MNDTLSYLAYGVALVLAVHGAYSGKVTEICAKIGLGLEGATGPTGFQDAITPPETTRGIMINWVITVAVLAAVWWQFGAIVFAATAAIRVVGRVIAGAKFSSEGWNQHFVRKVFGSMARRQADYVKNGDTMRAEALGDLVDRFKRSPFSAQVAG